MLRDDEIVEAVDEPQRVDDRRAERIAAIRELEVRLSLVDLVLAQQVHAELGVRRVEIGLDLDGLLQQRDGLAVTPRDDVEMRRDRVRVAVAGVQRQRALRPRAVRRAAQQVDGGFQRVDLERRALVILGELERFVERVVAGVDRAVLERRARHHQMRFERLVGRLVDDLLRPTRASSPRNWPAAIFARPIFAGA